MVSIECRYTLLVWKLTFVHTDAAMKVTVEVLQRVYDNMQDQGDHINDAGEEYLDPDSHLHVVDAYDMPLWNWSLERGTFERCVILPMTTQTVINLDMPGTIMRLVLEDHLRRGY